MKDDGYTLQEWEFDHQQLPMDLPPSEDELLGWIPKTSCAQCDVLVDQRKAIIGCIRTAGATIQEHFCSTECRNSWRASFAYTPVICYDH